MVWERLRVAVTGILHYPSAKRKPISLLGCFKIVKGAGERACVADIR